MKRSEALDVVGMIVNGWQGGTWTEEQMLAYASGIESLDAGHATQAVLRAQKEMKFRPSVAELREYVRVEAKVDSRWREAEPEKQPRPMWVQRWARARLRGDVRPFPEQAVAIRDLGWVTPDVPYDDPAAWVQGGEYLEGPDVDPLALVLQTT